MVAVLDSKREAIVAAAARYGVVCLYVFGSALRDDFRPGESDIDLLVEFKPMDPFALKDAYFGLLEELRQILDTPVDLVMADALKNRYIRADVDRTKQVLYAA
jgi:predicted nucleotidyltransferase